MFCVNCGAKLKDGAKFCSNCGAAVLDEEEVVNGGTDQSQPVPEPNFSETAQEREEVSFNEPASEIEPEQMCSDPEVVTAPLAAQEQVAPEETAQEGKPAGKAKKSSAGRVVLSLFLAILLLVYALGASAVGIIRSSLEKENVLKTVNAVLENEEDLASLIYEQCEGILGENISKHPELNEESLANAIKAVRKDRYLSRDVNKYLTAYTDYAINGGKINGMTGDDVISFIQDVNDISPVYKLSKSDRELIREYDFSSVSKINKSIGVDVSVIHYALSVASYVILIVLAIGMAVLILFANSWKFRAAIPYVSIPMIILGGLFLLMACAAFVLSLVADTAWIFGSIRGLTGSVAIRGCAYLVVGLLSILITKKVGKKSQAIAGGK